MSFDPYKPDKTSAKVGESTYFVKAPTVAGYLLQNENL
jgi:hypothetical protein